MSLLTPLYVLGALAVGLPVLFHLIQRRPRGQMAFSSLMFLSPSPPRLSRRSRLDNLLLLLLRGLALILLALAFARPFVRSSAWLDEVPPDRRVLVLVDTSASMQRSGIWQQVQDQVREVLDGLSPTDDVALYTFDASLRPVVPFSDSTDRREVSQTAAIVSALREVSPSYAGTELGDALSAAADVLHTSREDGDNTAPLPKQIVLITDLQGGSDLEGLRSYTWPPEVRVDVRQVTSPKPTNARAIVLSETSLNRDDETATTDDQWRVTVQNSSESANQQFHLGWANHAGELLREREHTIQVPPGGSRTIRVPYPPAGAEQLLLTGDEQPFDNAAYIVRPRQREMEVVFVGEDPEDVKESLFYYLSRADFDDPRRAISIERTTPSELTPGIAPAEVPLVVVAEPVTIADEEILREYVRGGGNLLVVLSQEAGNDAMAEMVERLAPGESLRIGEADVNDYAMLVDVDFTHDLFRPFADPRFNDFTKIQFWSHRVLQPGEESAARVLARFDDRSPALLQYGVEGGRIWVLAAGWQPVESQLALSSKFVPLLSGMLESPRRSELRASYTVGDRLTLPSGHAFKHLVAPDGAIHDVTTTDAESRPATAASTSSAAGRVELDRPGIYRLSDGEQEFPFAVNLAVAESRTAPLDVSELEALGVQSGRAATAAELEAERRRLRDFELERSQNLWQWLLASALAVLCIESWLAGRLSRTPATPVPARA